MIALEWYDEITSTADVLCARARAGDVPHGTLLAAGRQTCGHGRGGQEKPFFSPPGGCYMSLLLRGVKLDGLPPTPRAALAAKRVLARCGCHVGVKWVNDLFLGDKKAGGILARLIDDCVVISCGINLYQTEAPPPYLRNAIAYCFQEKAPDPKEFAQELAAEIMALCAGNNNSMPNNSTLLEEYRAASIVLGREITFEENGARLRAKALDITSTGGLMIRENGRERVLASGSITLPS